MDNADSSTSNENYCIVGLHEDHPALFQSRTGFFAVLDRAAEIIAAGPFYDREEASKENVRLRAEGVHHAVVTFFPASDDFIQTNYCGMSMRAPYTVHWWNDNGVMHQSSFEDAPMCPFWQEIDCAIQQHIIRYNKAANHA